jgi:hypothetical protein
MAARPNRRIGQAGSIVDSAPSAEPKRIATRFSAT